MKYLLNIFNDTGPGSSELRPSSGSDCPPPRPPSFSESTPNIATEAKVNSSFKATGNEQSKNSAPTTPHLKRTRDAGTSTPSGQSWSQICFHVLQWFSEIVVWNDILTHFMVLIFPLDSSLSSYWIGCLILHYSDESLSIMAAENLADEATFFLLNLKKDGALQQRTRCS